MPIAVILLLTLFAAAAQAQSTEGVGSTGQFEYRIPRIDISFVPGTGRTLGQATVGVEIKNTGDAPVKIALVAPWPVLQVEGGFQFSLPHVSWITGLAYCNAKEVAYCESYSKDYPVLQNGQTLFGSIPLHTRLDERELGPVKQGRFSGQLFVHDLGTGRSWIEPFPVGNVQVVNKLH